MDSRLAACNKEWTPTDFLLDADLMLGQRRRRWPNIKAASEQRLNRQKTAEYLGRCQTRN